MREYGKCYLSCFLYSLFSEDVEVKVSDDFTESLKHSVMAADADPVILYNQAETKVCCLTKQNKMKQSF